MNIQQIDEVIRTSEASDWRTVEGAAGYVAAKPGVFTDADGTFTVFTTFSSYAVHKDHPELQLVWGHDIDEDPVSGRAGEGRDFPELPSWPDPRIRMEEALVLWHGMPVDHFYYLSVDGHRGYVPVPNIKPNDFDKEPTHYFLRSEIARANLLGELAGQSGLRSYTDEAAKSLQVVDHPDQVKTSQED